MHISCENHSAMAKPLMGSFCKGCTKPGNCRHITTQKGLSFSSNEKTQLL